MKTGKPTLLFYKVFLSMMYQMKPISINSAAILFHTVSILKWGAGTSHTEKNVN